MATTDFTTKPPMLVLLGGLKICHYLLIGRGSVWSGRIGLDGIGGANWKVRSSLDRRTEVCTEEWDENDEKRRGKRK